MSSTEGDHESRLHVAEKMVSLLETSNEQLTRQVAELIVQVKAVRTELRDHEVKEIAWHSDAFPGGDLTGHRKAHESMIEASKAQEAFWRELRIDIAKKGLWFLIITVCGLVIAGIVSKGGLAGLFFKGP